MRRRAGPGRVQAGVRNLLRIVSTGHYLVWWVRVKVRFSVSLGVRE